MSNMVITVADEIWSKIRDDLMAFGWISRFDILQTSREGLTILLYYPGAFREDVLLIVERHSDNPLYDEGY